MAEKKRSKPTVKQISKAVDLVFSKYDKDGSGFLDQDEIIKILGDSLIKQGKS